MEREKMKIYCQYHASLPAHWQCPTCGGNFCQDCVVKRPQGGYLEGSQITLCPSCNRQVQWLGTGNIIEPFWNHLNRFFIYPIYPKPLLLNLALAVAASIFTGPGLTSSLIQIGLWAVLLKYAYACLQATATGNLVPPPVTPKTISEDLLQVFKQVVLFAILVFVFQWVSTKFEIFLGFVYLSLAILFMPAMIMILVATNSVFSALNPLIFVPVVFRIGWPYLLLYLFLSILGAAPMVIGRMAETYLPPWLFMSLQTFAANYYTIISYHLMGYVLLQYHEQIGYQVDPENFIPDRKKGPAGESDPTAQLLNRTEQLIKEGKHTEAADLIGNETKSQDLADLALYEKYFTLLEIIQRIPEMVAHGNRYLDLLVKKNKTREACDVYLKCVSKDSHFDPDPAVLFKLGGWLKDDSAISAYNKLVKNHPSHPLVPKALFKAAQLFKEKMAQPEKAKQVLGLLMKRFPRHEIIPLAKSYQKRNALE
jgi:hypothetical protein